MSEVDLPLSKLTNEKMRHLLLLKNSEKYIDRLTDSMHSQLRLCDKMEVRSSLLCIWNVFCDMCLDVSYSDGLIEL